jgi:hypothetical protein
MKGSPKGFAFPFHRHDRLPALPMRERIGGFELAAVAGVTRPQHRLGTGFELRRCVRPHGTFSCQQSCAGGGRLKAIPRRRHRAAADSPIVVGRASPRAIPSENSSYSFALASASCSCFGRDILGSESWFGWVR